MHYIPLPDSYPVMGYAYDPVLKDLHIAYDRAVEGTYHNVPASEVAVWLDMVRPAQRYWYLRNRLGNVFRYTGATPKIPRKRGLPRRDPPVPTLPPPPLPVAQ